MYSAEVAKPLVVKVGMHHQKSPGPGMETHWEESVKPRKYQHWSLDQESIESELVAIPETSDKSESTVHGSTAQVINKLKIILSFFIDLIYVVNTALKKSFLECIHTFLFDTPVSFVRTRFVCVSRTRL